MARSLRLLDLCCGAGGASAGYVRAGFEVVGVDIEHQPRYPFEFHQGDALEVLEDRAFLAGFDAVHVSWPCQGYSVSNNLPSAKGAPRLLERGRELLRATGLPWVSENVVGAPMPGALMLCGTTFGLRAPDVDGVTIELRRHRLFESSIFLLAAGGCDHRAHPVGCVMGAGGGATPRFRDDPHRSSGYVPAISVIRALMGIDWMNKHELSQAIPPAYTEFIGEQLAFELRANHIEGIHPIASSSAPEVRTVKPSLSETQPPTGAASTSLHHAKTLGLDGADVAQ